MSPAEVFACEICNNKFSLKRNLKRHLKSKHLRQLWDCRVCGKSFNRNDNLKVHAKTCLQRKSSEDRDKNVGTGLPRTATRLGFDQSQKIIATAIANIQRTNSTTDHKQQSSAASVRTNCEWKENMLPPCISPNEPKLRRIELAITNPRSTRWLSTSLPAEFNENTYGEVGGCMPSTPEFGNSTSTSSTIKRKRGRPRKSFTKELHLPSPPAGSMPCTIQSNDGQSTTSSKTSEKYPTIVGIDPVETHKNSSQTNSQKQETLEELHIRLARKAVRQTILNCLPRNVSPLMQDPQVSGSDLRSYCVPDDLGERGVAATGSPSSCKQVRRESLIHFYDNYEGMKIEASSSDDDCELVDVMQHGERVSSNNENTPTNAEESLPYDIVQESPFLLKDNPQYLVVRLRGKADERHRSKISKNELKRKIAKLSDERDELVDQEKFNEEKMKILLQRKQQLEEEMANVALQKAVKETELNNYTCVLEEWERD